MADYLGYLRSFGTLSSDHVIDPQVREMLE